MMSDLIFVLSDQNGDSVGHKSFQGKKLFAALLHATEVGISSDGVGYFGLVQT